MRRHTLLGVSLAILLITVVWLYGRAFAVRQLQTMLQDGLGQPVTLSLSTLGLTGATLTDVRIGGNDPLLLPKITLDYSPEELWHGQLRQLVVTDVVLALANGPAGWRVTGWNSAPAAADDAPLTPPVTPAAVAAIPLAALQIVNGKLLLSAPGWQAALPLTLDWRRDPQASMQLTAAQPGITAGSYSLTAQTAQLTLQHEPQQRQWLGPWRIENLQNTGTDHLFPELQAAGTVTVTAAAAQLQGELVSADRAWLAQFTMRLPLPLGAPPKLVIKQVTLPWLGGQARLGETTVPLDGKTPVKLELRLEKIALPALLQQITGQHASGTGTVSGTIPLTLQPDGTPVFGNGSLQADTPGTIVVSPETIPGDNPQLALVRDILADLHYQNLALGIANGADGRLALQFALEGSNPAVQNGKPVKLRVNLGGDVLGLVQNNLLLFTAPQRLLSREPHDKN